MPTHAPTGSTSASRLVTAIFERAPGSRAHGDDADDAFVDLGDLGLEELVDEARIGAREDDLRAAGLAVDVLHVGDDAIAGTVGLARRLLAERQDALGATEVDDDVVALLEAPDDAADELALAVLVLVEDDVALGVAHALEEHLLGGLGGDAAELAARLLELEQIAELLVLLGGLLRVVRVPEDLEAELLAELGLEPAPSGRPRARSRARARRRIVDHGHVLEEVDLPGVLVEAGLELAVRAEGALRGLEDGCLDRLDQDLLVDALVLGDHFDGREEADIGALRSGLGCHGHFLETFFLPGFGAGPNSKTRLAFSTSSRGTS